MKRRRRGRDHGESFGTSLADILTTALGCVLLLFLVVVLNVRASLSKATEAQSAEQAKREAAQRAMLQEAAEKGQAERALKAQSDQVRALEEALRQATAAADARGTELAALRGAAAATLADLDPHTASPVDVMLVVDGTRSMAPSLEAARRDLKATVKALRVVSPTARVGVVVFRDRREPGGLRLQVQPLTAEVSDLQAFLDDIQATSTAVDVDRPEWLCGGIGAAAGAAWRPEAIRLMLVVSDAADHDPSARDCVEEVGAFQRAGGRVHVLTTHPSGFGVRHDVTQDYEDVVLPQHRLIAEAGGGLHLEGADADALLTEVLGAAFRSRTAAPVDRLRRALDPPPAE